MEHQAPVAKPEVAPRLTPGLGQRSKFDTTILRPRSSFFGNRVWVWDVSPKAQVTGVGMCPGVGMLDALAINDQTVVRD